MIQVEKRDHTIVDFDIKKICSALEKAFDSVKAQWDSTIIETLALHVTADFQPKIKNGIIQVEDIQDSAEKVLSQTGYAQVSKAYILYRKQRENVRQLNNAANDYRQLVDQYLNYGDEFEDDSLRTYSVGGLILSNSGAITSNYWLSEIYDDEIKKAHEDGDFYIHDLDMLTPDSAGWPLGTLLHEGLGGIQSRMSSRPPKHLPAAVNQIVNFLGILQNEWAGAQYIGSLDTYLAPIVKKDKLSYRDVYEAIESLIYGLNTPSRWGTQAPFSCVSLDWNIPDDLKDTYCEIAGEKQDFTYGDCKSAMTLIQKAFLSILLQGDNIKRGFQFPIPSIWLSDKFDWKDSENNELLFSLTAKYGTPHFINGISTSMRSKDQRTSRFVPFDPNVLLHKSGGFFGYGECCGSIGTVTLNLPRIAYLSKNEEEFFERLDDLLRTAARSLNVKRQVLGKLLKAGLYPYTSLYIDDFSHHASTIGVLGMNEACLNASWIEKNLMDENALAFAKRVLEHINGRLIEFQHKYQSLYVLEATPAESVSTRLAQMDQEKYPDMHKYVYYTNSTMLPADATEDVFDALDREAGLLKLYSGGTLFDVNLKEGTSEWKAIRKLVQSIASNYPVPVFAISPIYSICPDHGYLYGIEEICPHCSKKTEIWARTSGYYRSVHQWSEGKKAEFLVRKSYNTGK